MTTINPALGHCYQLAAEKLLYGRVPESGVLVHGTVQGPGFPPNPHAWVEADGSAWEPILGQWFHPAAVFYGFFKAKAHHRYTRAEVAAQLERTRHWGPWAQETEALNVNT